MEIGEPEPKLPDEISAFSRWSHLTRRVSRSFAGAVGRVEVGPAVGGEYSEMASAFRRSGSRDSPARRPPPWQWQLPGVAFRAGTGTAGQRGDGARRRR